MSQPTSGGASQGSIPVSNSYGSMTHSTTFSINTNQNNGGASPTQTGTNPASTGPVCPFYDEGQYTDPQGSTYRVDCNSTYSGNVLQRTNTTSPARAKRQASVGVTAPQCMVLCDKNPACIAINVDCAGMCTLLESVTNTVDGACGVAARRLAGSSGGGASGVSTVTVCAARTGTTTVFTTATLTTCAANGQCPPGTKRGMML